MSAMAKLVTLLRSTEFHGISTESISAIIDIAMQHGREEAEFHGIPRNSTESAEEKRRRKDRERKRIPSGNSTENAETKKPPLILTSLSSSEETLKKERKKESSGIRARAQLVPIPDDWKPSEHSFEVAEKYGSSVSDTEPIFRDYLKSSGKRYADYDAAFYNFLRNQRKFNANGSANVKPKSPIIQAADDLIRRIASFDGPPREAEQLRGDEGKNPSRLLSYGRG